MAHGSGGLVGGHAPENDLTISGLRVLRSPAFALRDSPGVVAGQIRAALGLTAR